MTTNMGQSDPDRWGPTHLVELACCCPDVEDCETEKYISDIRILHAELQRARVIYAEYAGSDNTMGGLG